jgi:ubiquinone/menaquinone biosynthesis C-methylase UbiE
VKYNPAQVAAFYDCYGEQEWDRLSKNPAALVSFHIHQHYLKKYVKSTDSVLEVGAGAGRFTIELAKLGAVITVGDISSEQLKLNQKYAVKYQSETSVSSRLQLDITDLSMFEAATFDVVVCYGGALSYVLEQASIALDEMLRVLKPEGYLLLSVMSIVGTTQAKFEVITEIPNFTQLVDQVNGNGFLNGRTNNGHQLKMYRAKELKQLCQSHQCQIMAMSASNYLSLNRNKFLEEMLTTDAWANFLRWELDFCAEDGCLDSGTHIISVMKKTNIL